MVLTIHLKVEKTKQWRVVQGSEKQVGEEPSLLSVWCLKKNQNAPKTFWASPSQGGKMSNV